ncbi:MAG: hypothetical protein Q3M30_00530 [Candidatus Electrothrix sp. Rat3]|nr:hypothetical protein [Candidatus Electrothrix rattekaaiensis]
MIDDPIFSSAQAGAWEPEQRRKDVSGEKISITHMVGQMADGTFLWCSFTRGEEVIPFEE